jgi:serine/threonine-protein kinase
MQNNDMVYTRHGALHLFRQAADRPGTAERLTESGEAQMLSGVTPDGKWAVLAAGTPRNLKLVALGDDTGATRPAQASGTPPRVVQALMQTRFEEQNGIVSPDGRWLAYESNASGRIEVYVRPFPNVRGGQWQISTDGGRQPLWARSGREPFYFAGDGTLMGVPVEARRETWSSGAPAKLLEPRYFTGALGAATIGRTYDVSPDGRRFLMIKEGEGGDHLSVAPQIVVVQNWSEELKRLVPIG